MLTICIARPSIASVSGDLSSLTAPPFILSGISLTEFPGEHTPQPLSQVSNFYAHPDYHRTMETTGDGSVDETRVRRGDSVRQTFSCDAALLKRVPGLRHGTGACPLRRAGGHLEMAASRPYKALASTQ